MQAGNSYRSSGWCRFNKIYVTSGLYDPFLGKPRDEFSKKEIEALCDEAANSGKR